MINVNEAYAIFKDKAIGESLASIAEHDDCFSFITKENSIGVYLVFKDTGDIEIEPYARLVLQPRKCIRSYKPKELREG